MSGEETSSYQKYASSFDWALFRFDFDFLDFGGGGDSGSNSTSGNASTLIGLHALAPNYHGASRRLLGRAQLCEGNADLHRPLLINFIILAALQFLIFLFRPLAKGVIAMWSYCRLPRGESFGPHMFYFPRIELVVIQVFMLPFSRAAGAAMSSSCHVFVALGIAAVVVFPVSFILFVAVFMRNTIQVNPKFDFCVSSEQTGGHFSALKRWFKPQGEWHPTEPQHAVLLYRVSPLIGETKPGAWSFKFVELTRKMTMGILVGFSLSDSRPRMYALLVVAVLDVVYIVYNRHRLCRTAAIAHLEVLVAVQRLITISVMLASLNGTMSQASASSAVVIATIATLLMQIALQLGLFLQLVFLGAKVLIQYLSGRRGQHQHDDLEAHGTPLRTLVPAKGSSAASFPIASPTRQAMEPLPHSPCPPCDYTYPRRPHSPEWRKGQGLSHAPSFPMSEASKRNSTSPTRSRNASTLNTQHRTRTFWEGRA